MWFLARVKPNSEEYASKQIVRQGRTCYIVKSREDDKVVYPFRPYIFVYDPVGQFHWLENTYGVAQVIKHAEGRPYVVPDPIVRHLKTVTDEDGFVDLTHQGLKRNELVIVVAGQYNRCMGLFRGYRPQREVIVLLHLMGKNRKVRVPEGYVRRV